MRWAIGLTLTVLLIGLVLVLILRKSPEQQAYDCRERVGDNPEMQIDCLVYRYGWDRVEAGIQVYADLYDRRIGR